MYNQNNGMYSGYEVETSTTSASKETFTEKESSMSMGNMGYSCNQMNYGMMNSMSCPAVGGMVCAPVYECPQERVIHREIMHEVPQV